MASVSVASDGSLLAAGNNLGDVYIWRVYQNHDSTTLLPCRAFKAHKDYLTRLLLSPDIKYLATCSSDHTVRVWKIDMNEEHLEDLNEPQNPPISQQQQEAPAKQTGPLPNNPNTITLSHSQPSLPSAENDKHTDSSPDPKLSHSTPSLASTASQQFRPTTDLISLRRPLPCHAILDIHQRWVWDCAFSADSAYLVTVCSDHYARLWEILTGKIIRQYSGHHRGAGTDWEERNDVDEFECKENGNDSGEPDTEDDQDGGVALSLLYPDSRNTNGT
ncbi:hypothetical protein AYO21_03482 [Fonsecaea monophora]|uniref:Uncharacterized protein n=1 Tax=Fonsecaea monophora TaxID=254056 RepID=A0A177FDD5_9EURO|nr:hypothetical protein AYO21_03482 [Fonsecaea monophora]OAG42314.1 hypothetical protein AYO21_03482 [Fonsecaea monophora]